MAEILATLDDDGGLDALPFMPEMLPYCGQRFQVFRSAHKTCVPPSVAIRSMTTAVHLKGLRCDGTAHAGCQAGCLLFWKEAWLRRVPGPESPAAVKTPADTRATPGQARPRCSVETLTRATRARVTTVDGGGSERYRCQATELTRATSPARWWDLRLYVRDVVSRNVRPTALLRYLLIAAGNMVLRRADLREYPRLKGRAGDTTPSAALDLQPGEWVQVRSKDDIMRTLNPRLRNRGLSFDAEMVPYCGRTVRVLRRARRFIDDRTGALRTPPNPCIILDDVTCSGCYSRGRLFCPRSIYPFWHEIWLTRADPEEPGRG